MKLTKQQRAANSSEMLRRALRWICALLAGFLLLMHAPTAKSQPSGVAAGNGPAAMDPGLLVKLKRRGDLILKDTTLAQALFSISESWGVNLVIGDEVKGQVNGSFKNAPLHEVLDSILLANGYSYRPVGQSLVVMKLGSLGDSNPLFETATIKLLMVKPEDAATSVKMLSSSQGKVHAVPSANSLLIIDFPEQVRQIRQLAARLDEAAGAGSSGSGAQLQIAHFAPQYVLAKTLKDSMQTVLSKDGKVTVIEAENRLVVVDYPQQLQLAVELVDRLDVPRPQIRITAFIYDVGMEDMERLGINWYHGVKGNSLTAAGTPAQIFSVESLMSVPAAAGPSSAMTFMSLTRNFDVNAVLLAMRECKDAKLLADPSVLVVDREQAKIQIVTEIPYQQLTQTSAGGNIGTTAFREAGVTLTVKPYIANDGTVLLDVTPSFSRLTGYTQGESPQPIIDKREATTFVRVVNKQTLVIGGLRQRTDINEHRGIPYLKDIPLVGALFRSHDISSRESELVVFLTPEITVPATPPMRPRHKQQISTSWEQLERIQVPERCEDDEYLQREYGEEEIVPGYESMQPQYQQPQQQRSGPKQMVPERDPSTYPEELPPPKPRRTGDASARIRAPREHDLRVNEPAQRDSRTPPVSDPHAKPGQQKVQTAAPTRFGPAPTRNQLASRPVYVAPRPEEFHRLPAVNEVIPSTAEFAVRQPVGAESYGANDSPVLLPPANQRESEKSPASPSGTKNSSAKKPSGTRTSSSAGWNPFRF